MEYILLLKEKFNLEKKLFLTFLRSFGKVKTNLLLKNKL